MDIFYILILGGILLNVLGILFTWPILNIAAFLMIVVGAFRLAPLCKGFRTTRNLGIIAVPFSVLSLLVLITNTGGMQHAITCTAIGINVFFIIYVSYYFTAGIINYAQTLHQMAVTRNLMTAWALFGIMVFVFFMANAASLIAVIIFALKLILLMFSLYYLFQLFGVGKIIFKNNVDK